MNVGLWIQKQPKINIFILATFLFLADEFIDYRTGPELNMSFFHLVPLFLIVWNAGFLPGLAYSFFCAIVMLFVTIHPLLTLPTAVQAFNVLANLVFYLAFIAVLAQLKKYLEKVTFMAEVDGLTNLLNPRTFLQRAEREIRGAAKAWEPVTVLFIDVDDFKRLNDTFGHGAGDEVLKSIGKTLNAHFRKRDLRARMGGDEFAVLLPGFPVEAAKAEIPRFHENLNRSLAGTKGAPTCSIGAVSFLKTPASAQAALAEADSLMYQVKLSGKNSWIWKATPSQGSGPGVLLEKPVATGVTK